MSTFADLSPISLEELVERASLQTRTDRKYVVPVAAAGDLRRLVGPRARVLELGGRRGFGYDSTYFDTPDLASYRMAAHSRRRRFKLRTRSYAETGTCFWEVKLRGMREATVKDRIEHPADQPDRLTPAASAFSAELLTAARIEGVDVADVHPTLRTTYRRTTLLMPDAASRVTVDAGLVWESADGRRVCAGDVLVVETKTAPGSSDLLDRRLWALGHRPVRLSKYATGMSLLHPDLPGNRWHSTRQRRLRAGSPER